MGFDNTTENATEWQVSIIENLIITSYIPQEEKDDEQLEELIDIDRVEGRLKASALKKITDIVDKHPDEATSIIRGWMYQET